MELEKKDEVKSFKKSEVDQFKKKFNKVEQQVKILRFTSEIINPILYVITTIIFLTNFNYLHYHI